MCMYMASLDQYTLAYIALSMDSGFSNGTGREDEHNSFLRASGGRGRGERRYHRYGSDLKWQ